MTLRRALLLTPVVFVTLFVLGPLVLAFVISFWERAGFSLQPAASLAAYRDFFGGVRLQVLTHTLAVAAAATAVNLILAYPIAYYLAMHARMAATRIWLLVLTIPFLVNHAIRNFSWSYLLGRNGPVNETLMALGLIDQPISGLLFSDFSVFVGLVTAYMPFMVFPIWLSLRAIDQRLIEASWLLGAGRTRTFLRVTLPLSAPGVFAACVFSLVGVIGESVVSTILGGAGYQLIGNSITSALSVLNHPLAAAMSSVVVLLMTALLALWSRSVDVTVFLGKITRWRSA